MTFLYTDISLQEFPGEVSLVIYSSGCQLKCPWCFNPQLREKKPLSYKQIKDAIDEHRDFVTAVVFSGGEPLLNPFLKKSIQYAKSNGLKIKLNTNGLVNRKVSNKNWYLGLLDYVNISIKGGISEYQYISNGVKFTPSLLHGNILEYSFVYSPTLWAQPHLNAFHDYLNHKILRDWHSLFESSKWSQPDIFTISQMQVGECLDPQYNDCRVPTFDECVEVGKIFQDIPRKKVIIETKEYGRVDLGAETKNRKSK